MNKTLEEMKEIFIEQVKGSDCVLGAWNFGSEMHGLSDEYSDVDIILLIDGKQFAQFEKSLESYLQPISDEILLCWPEEFNGEAIINNGYLLSNAGHIFQFDVFLLNSDKLDDFMCRLHYTNLREDNIIFDKTGDVKKLIQLNLTGSPWAADVEYLEKTYWYHANMTCKYFKRKDYFKLYNVLHTMYETHVSMLLTGFDETCWGGSANKLHFIPKDKQEHLKKYYCSEDCSQMRANLIDSMRYFQSDTKEVFERKNIAHASSVGDLIIGSLMV
ncbi:MAG: aminoglycoside 6-adenylyltransferase [Lachnospiraceae bacterium]|nr:aminoglycoside 6-adenylyltransferase [Lachnospiraceae bacterium]